MPFSSPKLLMLLISHKEKGESCIDYPLVYLYKKYKKIRITIL